jgi:hypothetical protein
MPEGPRNENENENGNDPNDPNDPNVSNDLVVLWRLVRGRSTAHATIFPADKETTLTWFFDGVMDRAENYSSMGLALARADDIRGVLLRDGWNVAAEDA